MACRCCRTCYTGEGAHHILVPVCDEYPHYPKTVHEYWRFTKRATLSSRRFYFGGVKVKCISRRFLREHCQYHSTIQYSHCLSITFHFFPNTKYNLSTPRPPICPRAARTHRTSDTLIPPLNMAVAAALDFVGLVSGVFGIVSSA